MRAPKVYPPVVARVLVALGGPTKGARALGISPSAVVQWVRVPARHIPRIESFTDIPGAEMRPDLYGALPKVEEMDRAA
jgi:DNA-binding transcriptional regulator YdaS (Cro superfamily)